MEGSIVKTLDEYRDMVQHNACICGASLGNRPIDTYPHKYGWVVEGFVKHGTHFERQWLSIKCPSCDHDNSLNHLGVHRDVYACAGKDIPTPLYAYNKLMSGVYNVMEELADKAQQHEQLLSYQLSKPDYVHHKAMADAYTNAHQHVLDMKRKHLQ